MTIPQTLRIIAAIGFFGALVASAFTLPTQVQHGVQNATEIQWMTFGAIISAGTAASLTLLWMAGMYEYTASIAESMRTQGVRLGQLEAAVKKAA